MPQFGATFYPGGVDDFYMPEVIAPAPQRVMPEVPHNMQQDLQRMESEARSVEPRPYGGSQHGREPSLSTVLNTGAGGYGQQYQPRSGPQATDYSPSNYSPFNDSSPHDQRKIDMRDLPSFSPFPKVSGEHIPPSDDEKEAVLAESREHVLHSNDPNMQICWARDVLAFVEIAAEAAVREAEATRAPGDNSFIRPTTPKIEHELRVDAINIVTYLADQGHPEAGFIRSKWLEFGKFGKRQDKKEAYSGYSAAAQQGWGRAEYRIGMLYENSNDVDKAMRHYNKGLALKDSAASYRLGMIALMGQHGQYKDLARGLELIHSAADTADEDAPQGAFVYGMIIARDLPDVNIPEHMMQYDVTVARQYIEKAAYLGFAKAQLKMGQAYELCQLGCDFNPALSLHYYGLAAQQGQPEACLGVSRWFLFGYEGIFAKNEQLAFKYAQLAAKAKLATGEFAMGYYYEIGIHVEKDLREARKWYELAAEHGNKDAIGRIEGLSQSKTLSKQDHETTALTRIKSKHGSQRGQRPERFRQSNAMATLSEGNSPRVSPQPSPRSAPYDQTEAYPNRAQAFGVNLPLRPSSAAPYPEDDRPAPSSLAVRPRSAAPYPEDEQQGGGGMRPPLSPHYNPNIRPSADNQGSAFGIRSQSPGRQGPPGPAMRSPQGSSLGIPPAGMDPNRGRPASTGWVPQVQGGYQQSSPVRAGYDQHAGPGGYDQRASSLPGGPAPNNAAHNRLTKANPNLPPPMRHTPPPGQYPPAPAHPGRDYGPRLSSHPAGGYNSYGGRASAAPHVSSPPAMSGGLGFQPGLPTGGPGGNRVGSTRPSIQLKDPPMSMNHGAAGRASAPPSQPRPGVASPTGSTSAAASTMSASAGHPAAGKPSKPASTTSGPSTFEAMGIPQGKNDDDCVVM